MTFGPGSLRGSSGRASTPAGVVDHRLARQHLINEYRRGRLARHQVCDAHPELVRAGREVGEPTSIDCPICADHKLVLVTYVFGARLPPFGRCITDRRELVALNRRADQLAAYVVEVCPDCAWHHLLRVIPVGGATKRRAGGASAN
jgi:Family of unknown function (DUF5318)